MQTISLDSTSLAFREQGSGTPVLFIHGTGTYSAPFEPVLAELPAAVRGIAYDRRGFGESTGPPASGLGDHVAEAAGLLESLAAAPATVVGSSSGGVIALRLAVERPELVSSLVLIEPAYQMAWTPSASASLALGRVFGRWLVRRDAEGAALAFYRWATGYRGGGNQFDSYPEEWRATALRHASTTVRELIQVVAPTPSRASLRRLRIPSAIVIGDAGVPVFHRTSRRALRAMPDAVEVPAPGAAHLAYTDQPSICARAITDAVARSA